MDIDPNCSEPALVVRGLQCSYSGTAALTWALRGVDLQLATGSFTAIMGPSGSGKTSLLHCAAGLQTPTAGEIRLAGVILNGRRDIELTEFRRRNLGVVFQSFNLLAALTVVENVELPLKLDGKQRDCAVTMRLLAELGLNDKGGHYPDQLSGGQQQRVALARALITDPTVVFADEPTGALDLRNARSILRLLRRSADNRQTIVLVTHDPVAAAYSDEVLFLADGRIVDRFPDPTASGVASRMAVLWERSECSVDEMEEAGWF